MFNVLCSLFFLLIMVVEALESVQKIMIRTSCFHGLQLTITSLTIGLLEPIVAQSLLEQI